MNITRNLTAFGLYTTCIVFFAYGAISTNYPTNYLSIVCGVVTLIAAEWIGEK